MVRTAVAASALLLLFALVVAANSAHELSCPCRPRPVAARALPVRSRWRRWRALELRLERSLDTPSPDQCAMMPDQSPAKVADWAAKNQAYNNIHDCGDFAKAGLCVRGDLPKGTEVLCCASCRAEAAEPTPRPGLSAGKTDPAMTYVLQTAKGKTPSMPLTLSVGGDKGESRTASLLVVPMRSASWSHGAPDGYSNVKLVATAGDDGGAVPKEGTPRALCGGPSPDPKPPPPAAASAATAAAAVAAPPLSTPLLPHRPGGPRGRGGLPVPRRAVWRVREWRERALAGAVAVETAAGLVRLSRA